MGSGALLSIQRLGFPLSAVDLDRDLTRRHLFGGGHRQLQHAIPFFTHGVWHWQGDRTEPGDRVTLHAHFNRGILLSLESKNRRAMLHQNSPRLGEMLGEDDWFDKMSAAGRDHVRFM